MAQVWDDLVAKYGEAALIADLERMDMIQKEPEA